MKQPRYDKPVLTGMDISRLEALVESMGEPKYRARQLQGQIYRGLAASFEEMSDLPLGFRQALSRGFNLHNVECIREVVGRDGTVKTLFRLTDGRTVESALMRYPRRSGQGRSTACISTQAGCAIGCPFCATGQQGFERNLTAGEIIDQALYMARYLREHGEEGEVPGKRTGHLTNLVFMGMGEPLANYDELMKAVRLLNSPDYFGLGARNMTVSTAGLVPPIRRLAREDLQVGLAVSLHAADNRLRDWLVPVNRKYPLEELIPACRDYSLTARRRLSFEYVLFKNINDSVAQAGRLATLLRGLKCHVNLITANVTDDRVFYPASPARVAAFRRELLRLQVNATVRQPRGIDITAGCGQLRSRVG